MFLKQHKDSQMHELYGNFVCTESNEHWNLKLQYSKQLSYEKCSLKKTSATTCSPLLNSVNK